MSNLHLDITLPAGSSRRSTFMYLDGITWAGINLCQLQLNPFDIIRLTGAMTQVMPHLDPLKSILNASFPMYEILPVILEEGLVDLYESQGWLEESLPPDGVGAPTLSQLHARIGSLVKAKGYEDRITSNITAALKTRIGSLLRGWKGKLFDHPSRPPGPIYLIVRLSSTWDRWEMMQINVLPWRCC